MNTLDRLDSITKACEDEIKEAEDIYFKDLRNAEAIRYRAWLHFTKAKEKAIDKRDILIAEFQKELDGLILSPK